MTSVKVSFVAPLSMPIAEKRGEWEKFPKVLGKALFSNGHKAIHCRAMLIALFDYAKSTYENPYLKFICPIAI